MPFLPLFKKKKKQDLKKKKNFISHQKLVFLHMKSWHESEGLTGSVRLGWVWLVPAAQLRRTHWLMKPWSHVNSVFCGLVLDSAAASSSPHRCFLSDLDSEKPRPQRSQL